MTYIDGDQNDQFQINKDYYIGFVNFSGEIVQGPQGPAGPVGPAGPAGPQGEQGIQRGWSYGASRTARGTRYSRRNGSCFRRYCYVRQMGNIWIEF